MSCETKIINDKTDSLTIGTPAKGGEIKVYGNFDNPEDFKRKVDNAFLIRQYAGEKLI